MAPNGREHFRQDYGSPWHFRQSYGFKVVRSAESRGVQKSVVSIPCPGQFWQGYDSKSAKIWSDLRLKRWGSTSSLYRNHEALDHRRTKKWVSACLSFLQHAEIVVADVFFSLIHHSLERQLVFSRMEDARRHVQDDGPPGACRPPPQAVPAPNRLPSAGKKLHAETVVRLPALKPDFEPRRPSHPRQDQFRAIGRAPRDARP